MLTRDNYNNRNKGYPNPKAAIKIQIQNLNIQQNPKDKNELIITIDNQEFRTKSKIEANLIRNAITDHLNRQRWERS